MVLGRCLFWGFKYLRALRSYDIVTASRPMLYIYIYIHYIYIYIYIATRGLWDTASQDHDSMPPQGSSTGDSCLAPKLASEPPGLHVLSHSTCLSSACTINMGKIGALSTGGPRKIKGQGSPTKGLLSTR